MLSSDGDIQAERSLVSRLSTKRILLISRLVAVVAIVLVVEI